MSLDFHVSDYDHVRIYTSVENPYRCQTWCPHEFVGTQMWSISNSMTKGFDRFLFENASNSRPVYVFSTCSQHVMDVGRACS
jgi:hypothetical protein